MDEKDYLVMLQALKDIPFGVGKKLLFDFLRGDIRNESIRKNYLDIQETFGGLSYEDSELESLLEDLKRNKLVEYQQIQYFKVLSITKKGLEELKNPSLHQKKLAIKYNSRKNTFSEKEKKLFGEFDFFLKGLNDSQKKAVIDESENVLCLAGPGTGKTNVLIKRVEYKARFKGIKPSNILCITFTRKARDEMKKRLSAINAEVETFNSFAEKIIKKNGVDGKIIEFKDKIFLVNKALEKNNIDKQEVINYFPKRKISKKNKNELFLEFVNDCFSVIDFYARREKEIDEFYLGSSKYYEEAMLLYKTAKTITGLKKEYNFRDYNDQLLTLKKVLKNKKISYDHVLVDEYQDVNDLQVDILDLLDKKSQFVVGDPRQSIYGWRGSNIEHVLKFEEKYDASVVSLEKNYRSSPAVVNLSNKIISTMGLPKIEPALNYEKDLKLLNFKTDIVEYEFVVQRILASEYKKHDIFVLTRTNRQLDDVSDYFQKRGIPYNKASEDNPMVVKGKVFLGTAHSAKGLEAEMVFLVGCHSNNYPCKYSDKPVLDLATEDYDRVEEERRLFYVGITRAKKSLYITYTGNPTWFLDEESIASINTSSNKNKTRSLYEALIRWRDEKASEAGISKDLFLKDNVLFEISQKQPLDEYELSSINGLDYSKAYKYGEEIISIVKNN